LSDRLDDDTAVLVLPGFYGKGPGGATQLFGRNGTDYSAAAAAAALQADKCQIWKDVDGFFSADPGVVSNALCLSEVSYEEAMELTYFGASVISAKALSPLAAAGIPCEVRNAYHPERPGTLVHGNAKRAGVVRGISHLPDVASITIQGVGLRGRVGIARRVTDALASHGISILLIVQSSSEFSITLCVRQNDVKPAARALEEEFHYERLHGLVDEIVVHQDRAVVSLVGDGMKHYRGIAARFLTAISAAGINVEVIAQGSTECAIAVVVKGDEAVAATRACHTAFFSRTTHIDVLLLGCGNVGSALLKQFQRQAAHLLKGNMELRVRAIANSRKLLVADDVIDLEHWEASLRDLGKPWSVDDLIGARERLGLINPTVIDCTTDEQLAGRYVELLENGFHVVAANKKANTASIDYYHALRSTAARNFKKFLYETNVGAGLPVIDTLQALIRSGDRLGTFEGILSGSLSMMLGLLDDGESLSRAVGKAMSLGFTEPDPRDDLSGMDVARKLLIIAREVGLDLELGDIEVEPVVPTDKLPEGGGAALVEALEAFDDEFAARAERARMEDKVLRYVGRIESSQCRVSIEETPVAAPLGAVRDGENALVLHTRYYAPIPLVLRGYGAGAEVTAAGVFADLLRTVWRPLD
jgi:aspartokinase/homoserine dehydrogenase 1